MDSTSKSSSTRPWLWVIESLASREEIDNSTLQDLIDVAPVESSEFGENTRELIARRCLGGLFGSASGLNFDFSSSLDPRLGSGVSRSCESILHQIFHEIPLSSPEIVGAEIWKRDEYTLMRHERASSMKLELEQLKESVIEGTHPFADRLKERSGLTLQNQDYQLPANDGKCNGLSKKVNESDMEAKQKSSSKEHSQSKNFSPCKRNRDYSFNVHDMRYLHEKQVNVEECDDFLRSEKKNKCYPPNIEFENDKSCQTRSLLKTKDDNEHHILPIPASIDDPEKAQHKSSKSQSEQEIDVQLMEPNAANPNPTWHTVSCNEVIVDSFNGLRAEHPEIIDFAGERHEFFSSHYLSSHDFSSNTQWRDQNLCMKCNEGSQLLVCKTTTCQLKVHESCLSKSAQFDGKGNFLCPFCAYSCAVSEYLEAKTKVFVSREELCIFLGEGIEDQAMELLEVYRKENNSSINDKFENILIKDNGNDHLLGTAREDNQENVNEANNLQFERSQQQTQIPMPCDSIPPLCRKKGIVNNGIDTVLNGEDTGNMKNPKVLRLERVEECPVAADHVTVGNGLFRHVPSVKQNTTGQENQQELIGEYNSDRTEETACAHYNEKNVSEDGSEKHANSRYSMRSRNYRTQCNLPLIPLLRKRKKVPWTAEEEDILMEGVQKFGVSDQQRMPWKQIWEFGSHVFLSERRPGDLKDKWKNMCKARRKLK